MRGGDGRGGRAREGRAWGWREILVASWIAKSCCSTWDWGLARARAHAPISRSASCVHGTIDMGRIGSLMNVPLHVLSLVEDLMVVRATHRSTRRLTLTRVFCKK